MLRDRGRDKGRTVHTLVAEAWIGPKPSGYEIDHVNSNPRDNRLVNLRYLTIADNRRRHWNQQ